MIFFKTPSFSPPPLICKSLHLYNFKHQIRRFIGIITLCLGRHKYLTPTRANPRHFTRRSVEQNTTLSILYIIFYVSIDTKSCCTISRKRSTIFSPDKFAFRHAHDKKVQFQNAVILKFAYFLCKDCIANHDDLL